MGDPAPFVQRATLKAAQEDTPVPAEIQNLMMRLLGMAQPFDSVGAFNAELERVLYDGDYSPTTFNMAFFMHTLFREENDKDGSGLKTEQADDYAAYAMVASGEGRGTEGHAVDFVQEEVKSKNKIIIFGGAAAVVVILGLLFVALRPKGESDEVRKMRETLALLQQQKAEEDMKKAALAGQGEASRAKQEELVKRASELKDATEKAKILEQLEAEKKKQADIERQQKELEEKRKQREKEVAAQQEKPAKVAPATAPAPPPAPKPEPPKPAAAAPTPAPTPAAVVPAPTPAPPPTAPAPSPSAGPVVVEETPVRMTSQATPAFPARAQQARWEAAKAHTVRLRVFVDANGRPQKVNVTQGVPGPWGFDEAATDAAMRSGFAPATREGKPVSGWIEYTVTFQAQFGRR
jgi:TonB family protein